MLAAEIVNKMTQAEKLQAIEVLWSSLLSQSEDLPVPVWHEDVLKVREARVKSGEAIFSDWDEAKQRIRKRVK